MSFGTTSGGGPQQFKPDFYKTPFDWMTPQQGTIDLLAKNIDQSVGSNMGMRNLYGSGIMKDVFADKLSEAAMGQTKLLPQGQWINPTIGQGAVNKTEFGLGS